MKINENSVKCWIYEIQAVLWTIAATLLIPHSLIIAGLLFVWAILCFAVSIYTGLSNKEPTEQELLDQCSDMASDLADTARTTRNEAYRRYQGTSNEV